MGNLTTLAAVKGYLAIDVGRTEDDALLDRLIAAGSAGFRNATRYEPEQQTYIEVRDGFGGVQMYPRNYPVASVTSVKIDGALVPVGGWALAGDRVVLTGYVFTRGVGNVELTYVAGYSEIPADIAQAVIEFVALRWNEKGRVGQTSVSLNGESAAWQNYAQTLNAKSVIDQYRRVSV